MDNLAMTYKREALLTKQELRRLVEFYGRFQKYIEGSAGSIVKGNRLTVSAETARLALEHEFEDLGSNFREWLDGEQYPTQSIARLIQAPEEFARRPDHLEIDLRDATAKFEHLIRTQHRELTDLHEKIALEEGESVAANVTELRVLPTPPTQPTSTIEEITKWNDLVEAGITWGGRLILFGPWLEKVVQVLG